GDTLGPKFLVRNGLTFLKLNIPGTVPCLSQQIKFYLSFLKKFCPRNANTDSINEIIRLSPPEKKTWLPNFPVLWLYWKKSFLFLILIQILFIFFMPIKQSKDENFRD